MDEFVDLFEKGDFVAFSRKFAERSIDKQRVANRIYEHFKPEERSERFFELEDWELNNLAFAVAVKAVAKGLATSQIRKILNMSNSIYRKTLQKEDIIPEVVKLNYTLAYTLGRQGKRAEIEPLAEVLSKVLPKFRDSSVDFEKVHNFLQAVVAYHKLLGGRD